MRRAAPVLLLLLAPSLAHAQASSQQAAAEALFEEGKRLMNAGDYAQACPKLAESQRLDPGAGTLLNLAACHEKAGRTATAWVTYRETITVAEKSNRKEWAAQATKRAKALEPLLSKIVIAVPSDAKVAGLVVKRDGQTVGEAEYGVPIPQDPGPHVVEASAPGKRTFSTSVDLGAKADTQTVTITLVAEDAAEPAPISTVASRDTSPSSEDGSGMRIAGIAVAGVGVLAIGAGIFFGLRASGLNEDSKANCNADQSRCNQDGLDQIDRAKGAARNSTIGFIAGGALLVGGAVLFFTAKSGGKTSASHTKVVPVAGANGGGLFLSGSF